MKLYNIKKYNNQVNFKQAVQQGLGDQQGLFFPMRLPEFTLNEINELLEMDFTSRSVRILSTYIGEELTADCLLPRVIAAFNFSAPIKFLSENIAVLELFHGPTLAFKDFGCRFMAQIIDEIVQNKLITILTATSGDTGAAVAHAFYGLDNIRVVILYPLNKISLMQEKLFCTLGGNIHTVAVKGDFDICQSLIKEAFDDNQLRLNLNLSSANSINISRILAQICYYFEAVSQLPSLFRDQLIISVPSGNFGNLTAGLLAKTLGLPVKNFIAATNENDTVPQYLKLGKWQPKTTVATLASAMDVSQPNNWPRIEELFKRKNWKLNTLKYGSVSDEIIIKTIREMVNLDYISEPHAAIAYRLLRDTLKPEEFGLFLGTAHPAKFKEIVEEITNVTLPLPSILAKHASLPILSTRIPAKFNALREFMMKL